MALTDTEKRVMEMLDALDLEEPSRLDQALYDLKKLMNSSSDEINRFCKNNPEVVHLIKGVTIHVLSGIVGEQVAHTLKSISSDRRE